jgi:hypothetical protein
MGWVGVAEINGVAYLAEADFQCDDDGRSWIIVDLRKVNDAKHIRVIIGQGEENCCDCEAATYRPNAVCKHAAAVNELLDQIDRLEQAERLLAEANDALAEALAVGPPLAYDPFEMDAA